MKKGLSVFPKLMWALIFLACGAFLMFYLPLSHNKEIREENKAIASSEDLINKNRLEYLEVSLGNIKSLSEFTFLGKVIEWDNDTAMIEVKSSNSQAKIIMSLISQKQLSKSIMVIIRGVPWSGGYEGGWYYKLDNVLSNNIQN